MFVLATFCWCLLLLGDTTDNFMFTRAIYHQKSEGPDMQRHSDGFISIRSFGKVQKFAMFALVSIPRFIVASLLLWIGCVFLAYTWNIDDLVLNAMALGFVLDVDELFFSAFAPYRVKNLLDLQRPLQMPARSTGNLDKVSAAVVSVSVLAIVYVTYTSDMLEHMQAVHTELCAGNLDFIVTKNPGSQGLYSSDLKLQSSGAVAVASTFANAANSDTYFKTAVLELASADRNQVPHVAVVPPTMEAIELLSFSSPAFGANQLRCMDHSVMNDVMNVYGSDEHYHSMTNSMSTITFNGTTGPTCEQLTLDPDQHVAKHPCLAYNNDKVRSICAIACGCSNPWLGNMMATTEHGCPGSCKGNYLGSLQGLVVGEVPTEFRPFTAMCEDIPVDILIKSTAWRNYVEALADMFVALISPDQGKSVKELALEEGCEMLDDLRASGVNMCSSEQGGIGRSLRSFCPHTCKTIVATACTSSDIEGCPSGCYSVSAPHVDQKTGVLTYTRQVPGNATRQTFTVAPGDVQIPTGQAGTKKAAAAAATNSR
jgi:hypothetical protein